MTFTYISLATSLQAKLGNAGFKAEYIQGSASMEERRKGKGGERYKQAIQSLCPGLLGAHGLGQTRRRQVITQCCSQSFTVVCPWITSNCVGVDC